MVISVVPRFPSPEALLPVTLRPVESHGAGKSLAGSWPATRPASRKFASESKRRSAHDDPGELRRLVGALEFSEAQRRHVLGLVAAWEQAHAAEDERAGRGPVSG